VYYTLWDDTNHLYPAPTQLSTGTGSQTLTIYNGSASGRTSTYFLGGYWATAIQAITPDLILISHGHNQGTVPAQWWGDYLCLTESLAEANPQAGIVMVLQNPESANTLQQQRATVYEQLARLRGYGLVNVCQAFLDSPIGIPGLLLDGVHPNPTGSALWAAEVQKLFQGWSRTGPILPMQPTSLNQRGFQLLKNNDFSTFSSGTIPTGWVQYNGTATYTKDATNYESPNGYSMLLTATGGAQSAIEQDLPLNLVRGKWVTALVRLMLPAVPVSTDGVVVLYDNVQGSIKSNANISDVSGGAFRWVTVSSKIPANATTARFYLYPDSSTTNHAINVDYASVVLGRLPMR
jgi:lysophospholipase L1-like esterase